MLRITIELVPHGDESKKKVIAQGEIVNTGTGDWIHGDYAYRLHEEHRQSGSRCTFEGELLRHPRRLEAMDLLYRVLERAIGYRNKEAG